MMTRLIDNWSELEAYIIHSIKEELKKIGEEIKKAIKMELKTMWYGRDGYSQNSNITNSYERTWELLECITLSPVDIEGNEYSVMVYYDTDKMGTYKNEGYLSQHESHISGDDIRHVLPKWIEEGTTNPSPIYNIPKTNIVGNVKDTMKDDMLLLQWFTYNLSKRGFKVVSGK